MSNIYQCSMGNQLSRMVAIYESKEELGKIFNEKFMQKNTNYMTFEEFCFACAVFINWSADFVVGDRMAFDSCVHGKTRFDNWEQMYQTAIHEDQHKSGGQ